MTSTYEKHPFLQSRGISESCDNPHVDSIFAPVLFFLFQFGPVLFQFQVRAAASWTIADDLWPCLHGVRNRNQPYR